MLALAGCDEANSPKTTGAKKTGKPHLVEIAEVQSIALQNETKRTGTLAARRSVRLFNQEEGRIDAVNVREGDFVKKGETLLRLDSRLLEAELRKAQAARELAANDLRRIRALLKKNVASQERLDQAIAGLKMAEAEETLITTRLDYAVIRAPFDGVVIGRQIEPGDVAPRHTLLIEMIDPNSLFTKVTVSELMLPGLTLGGEAEVRIDAIGSNVWKARITRVHPTVDPRTRQGTVEVDIDPVPQGAAAGQLCRVTLRTVELPRLIIPFVALRRSPEGEFVYLVEKGKVVRRDVQSGLRLGDRAEILDGLKPGDQVVVRGFLDLRPGKVVTVLAAGGQSDGN